MTDVLNAVIGGAPIGCVFALLAVGLVLTYRTAGVFNLAFGAQAFVSAAVYYDTRVRHEWPIWAALVLAVFVGYYVVWSVTPALHTPLMSVTNAISSVIVVGALLAVGVPLAVNQDGPLWARIFGFIALIFASVNIFGGFLVTQRMLAMYQKKQK